MVESGGTNLPDQDKIFNYGGKSFKDITNRSKVGLSTISIVFGNATAGDSVISKLHDKHRKVFEKTVGRHHQKKKQTGNFYAGEKKNRHHKKRHDNKRHDNKRRHHKKKHYDGDYYYDDRYSRNRRYYDSRYYDNDRRYGRDRYDYDYRYNHYDHGYNRHHERRGKQCFRYKVKTTGGVGGFRFQHDIKDFKRIDKRGYSGKICGRSYVEFELSKLDPGVKVIIKIDGKRFVYRPHSGHDRHINNWHRKYYSLNLGRSHDEYYD